MLWIRWSAMRAVIALVLSAMFLVVGVAAILVGAILAGMPVVWAVILIALGGFEESIGPLAPDALRHAAAGVGLMAIGLAAVFAAPRIKTWVASPRG
jgi:hypothetical protein